MRNISFALTTDQICRQQKDVTRRRGWVFLRPGDRLQPVLKAQGLKKGEQVQRLGPPIRVVSVTFERLDRMITEPAYGRVEVVREGFGGHPEKGTPESFVAFFAKSHKCATSDQVTRIEFEYTEPPQ